MERIGVRELRQHASRYLALVKAGESVEVTERGRLVAMLTPPDESQNARDRLVAVGRLIPAAHPTGRARAAQPVSIGDDEPSNRELLDLDREDRG